MPIHQIAHTPLRRVKLLRNIAGTVQDADDGDLIFSRLEEDT